MYVNNTGNSWMRRIPQGTGMLMALCIIIWILCYINPNFRQITDSKLGLHFWGASNFNPLQLISYQFVHGNFYHLFFNMFALFTFGSMLERVWGTGRYLLFYFICGVGAGLVQEVIWSISWEQDYISLLAKGNDVDVSEIRNEVQQQISSHLSERMADVAVFKNYLVTIGASGAIFGLLMGFAFVFPNLPMYIFFIPIPIKAKYIAIGYGVIELVLGASNALDTVAHYAHLGGMLFGLILVLYWRHKGTLYGKRF